MNQPSPPESNNDVQYENSRQLRASAVMALLILGFVLVGGGANWLGPYLNTFPNGSWNIQNAEKTSSAFRMIGFMLFGMGLLERTLLWGEGIVRRVSGLEKLNPRA